MIDLYTPIIGWLQRQVAGENWKWKVTFALIALSLFFQFPGYNYLADHLSGREVNPWWVRILEQRDHLFTYVAQPVGSHLEKTTFRLTIPLFAKVLHLGVVGVYALQFLLGGLMIFLGLRFCNERSNDKVLSALFVGAFVFTYAGSAAFFDIWGQRDPFAYFFLFLAVYPRSVPLIFISVLLAAFGDERALIASTIVLLFHQLDGSKNADRRPTWLPNKYALAVVAAWVVYACCRWSLMHYCGFVAGEGELGFKMFFKNLDLVQWALWSGLEGMWLLVIAFLLVVQLRFGFTWLLAFLAAFGMIIGAALLVDDTTRSMAYGFILLFVGFAVLCRHMERRSLQVLCFFVFLVCLVHPLYFTLGNGTVIPVDPVYIKALNVLKLRMS